MADEQPDYHWYVQPEPLSKWTNKKDLEKTEVENVGKKLADQEIQENIPKFDEKDTETETSEPKNSKPENSKTENA